jgi:hypothetical protein
VGYLEQARTAPNGGDRSFQLCGNEMNGGIGLKKRFKSFILFWHPFVAVVRQHRVISLRLRRALIEVAAANATPVLQTTLWTCLPSVFPDCAASACDRPFWRVDDDGLSSGNVAPFRISTVTMRKSKRVSVASVDR